MLFLIVLKCSPTKIKTQLSKETHLSTTQKQSQAKLCMKCIHTIMVFFIIDLPLKNVFKKFNDVT